MQCFDRGSNLIQISNIFNGKSFNVSINMASLKNSPNLIFHVGCLKMLASLNSSLATFVALRDENFRPVSGVQMLRQIKITIGLVLKGVQIHILQSYFDERRSKDSVFAPMFWINHSESMHGLDPVSIGIPLLKHRRVRGIQRRSMPKILTVYLPFLLTQQVWIRVLFQCP